MILLENESSNTIEPIEDNIPLPTLNRKCNGLLECCCAGGGIRSSSCCGKLGEEKPSLRLETRLYIPPTPDIGVDGDMGSVLDCILFAVFITSRRGDIK